LADGAGGTENGEAFQSSFQLSVYPFAQSRAKSRS
jgi:hypothetical protein